MTTSPEHGAPTPEFSTLEQARMLRSTIDCLLSQKYGLVTGFFKSNNLNEIPPPELFADFPAPADTAVMKRGLPTAKEPAYVTVARHHNPHKDDDALLARAFEGAICAQIELERGQWINLDNPNHPEGNKAVMHVLYQIAGSPNDQTGQADYVLQKYQLQTASSQSLLMMPQAMADYCLGEQLPEAVPYAEAEMLIDYAVGLVARVSLDKIHHL